MGESLLVSGALLGAAWLSSHSASEAAAGARIGEEYMLSRRRVTAWGGVGSVERGPSRSRATPINWRFLCRKGSR